MYKKIIYNNLENKNEVEIQYNEPDNEIMMTVECESGEACYLFQNVPELSDFINELSKMKKS